MAGRAEATYEGLVETARQAPVNGHGRNRLEGGGRLQWLHVAVSAQVTVYAILPGRGYEQSRLIVGAAYDGFLLHDGWVPAGTRRTAGWRVISNMNGCGCSRSCTVLGWTHQQDS